MARAPRIHQPGALYHVMLRGNNRAEIFFDDKDRHLFEALLADLVRRYNCRVHAYVFMNNHIHLAIQIATVSLSVIMQSLSLRYTRWINKRYLRVGHVFQGRYRAILVDADSYLLELTRYIHLNPIRANMIEELENYRWSSYRVYVAKVNVEWVTTKPVLSLFSQSLNQAVQSYKGFCSDLPDDGMIEKFNKLGVGGEVLGDDHFVDNVNRQAVKQMRPDGPIDIEKLTKAIGHEQGIPINMLRGGSRRRELSAVRKRIYNEYVDSGGSMAKLAEYFGRDITTISRQLK